MSGNIHRWNGKDFVFCFTTDDGTIHNNAWVEYALANNFRYSVGVNAGRTSSIYYDGADMKTLHDNGFDIVQHGWSHGMDGLSEACAMPPRGSLQGYFECDPLEGVVLLDALVRPALTPTE